MTIIAPHNLVFFFLSRVSILLRVLISGAFIIVRTRKRNVRGVVVLPPAVRKGYLRKGRVQRTRNEKKKPLSACVDLPDGFVLQRSPPLPFNDSFLMSPSHLHRVCHLLHPPCCWQRPLALSVFLALPSLLPTAVVAAPCGS